MTEPIESPKGKRTIFIPRRNRQRTLGTQKYPKFNIARDIAHQASACTQGLGSFAGWLCASPVLGHLLCRVISTWKGSPQYLPFWLPEGPGEQHQLHRDNPSITLLGARLTRAPTAPKSRAAHKQSVPGEPSNLEV